MLSYLLISSAIAMSTHDLYSWMNSNSRSANSHSFINAYPGIQANFSNSLTRWTQNQLAKSASKALQNYNSGRCTEGAFFKVVDSNKIAEAKTEVEKNFTNSLFLIESSYCLSNVELQRDQYQNSYF